MNETKNYNFILFLNEKVDELGYTIEKCPPSLVEVCLDDTDDIGEINRVLDENGLDCIGFGNANDGYYIIDYIFQESYDTINHRSCYKKVDGEYFLKVLEERTKIHCPDAFNN